MCVTSLCAAIYELRCWFSLDGPLEHESLTRAPFVPGATLEGMESSSPWKLLTKVYELLVLN